MSRIVAAALVVTAGTAVAGERWETISTEPFLIKAKGIEGSEIKEIWAEGEIAASTADVQSALLDADGFHRFMPYVKESRAVSRKISDGSQIVYTNAPKSSLV